MRSSDRDNTRVARLIDLLMDDATDFETKENIRAWFWSDVSRNAKDATILDMFRQMEPNPAPDETDRMKFAELAARLGMDGSARRVERKRGRIDLFRTPLRIAAAVALLLGLSGVAYLWIDQTEVTRVAEVIESGSSPRSIQLPDGSSVKLQANSTLTYDGDFASNRHVHLDGEALLTVEKSTNEAGESIPFSVITDDLKIDVYGTAFRVIDPADDGDILSIVTLYDGSVSVLSNDAVITLKPGQEYRFDHAAQKPNVALVLAREMIEHGFMPLLRFEDSNLGNLVTSLSANYGVQFEMPEDIDLSKGKFSGDFESEDLKTTLNILTKASAKLNFTLAGDKVVVKRK